MKGQDEGVVTMLLKKLLEKISKIVEETVEIKYGKTASEWWISSVRKALDVLASRHTPEK